MNERESKEQVHLIAPGTSVPAAFTVGAAMDGNHWTVFNGAGAVVADNMPIEVVRAYLTPERFARGWTAAFVVVVRTSDELAAIPPSGDKHSYGENCNECEGYCLRFPSWSKE